MNCNLCDREIDREDVLHINDIYLHHDCYHFIRFACDNTKIARDITHHIKKYRNLIRNEPSKWFAKKFVNKKENNNLNYYNKRLHKGWINEPMSNFVDGAEDNFKNMGEVKQYLEQKQTEKRKIYSFNEEK